MRQEKMSLQSKRELLAALKDAYSNATYGEKNRLLDGFQTATGYSRKHAIRLMRSAEAPQKKQRAARITPYNQVVKSALSTIWQAAGCICAKRLVPFLPELIAALERCDHICPTPEVRDGLLKMSPATADRLLRSERQRLGRSMSMTRPGAFLRRQIAVRTFAQWDDAILGFFEADLVAHNGGNQHGQFIHTLTLTDIYSGWTECMPLIRKSDDEVVKAIVKVQERFPMRLVGLDTDNGSEFINHNLSDYCKRENIKFTRSRVFKSNDQCRVEEKNGSVVRRFVGYRRLEGDYLHWLMNELYKLTSLYVNYFQPSCKLQSKEREGGHVTKRYDKARTPCQRLLEIDGGEERKEMLRTTFLKLNPVDLLTRIQSLQAKIEETTNQILRLPPSTAISESEKLILQAKERKAKPAIEPVTSPKTGRKSIVSEEVARVISFFLHHDPSMTATTLLPLLDKRYPGKYKKSNGLLWQGRYANGVHSIRSTAASTRRPSCTPTMEQYIVRVIFLVRQRCCKG
jgi:hypothetical protein